MSNQDPFWEKGKEIEGGYIIQKLLGKGGFGETYLAKNKQGKNVVIKTINQEISNHTYFRNDFDREAFRLAKLDSHDHIVTILDIITENDVKGIIMEYIQGDSPDKLLRKQGLPYTQSIIYIHQIGDALKFMHQKGWMHRDVHVRNIIIDNSDRNSKAILIDFGLCRPIDNDQLKNGIGCRGFAPIEQLNGSRQQGAYTDVYGLAATLYYLVTKKRPLDAQKRSENKPDGLLPPQFYCPNISDRFNDAIMKGLALEANDRTQAIEEWLNLIPKLTAQLTKNTSDSRVVNITSNNDNQTQNTEEEGQTVNVFKPDGEEPPDNLINSNDRTKIVEFVSRSVTYLKQKKVFKIPLLYIVILFSLIFLVGGVIIPFKIADKFSKDRVDNSEIPNNNKKEELIAYNNPEYGFEIKDTQNWHPTTEKIGFINLLVKLTPKEYLNNSENAPSIYIQKFSPAKTETEIIAEIKDKLEAVKIEEQYTITINDRTGEKIIYTGKKDSNIYKNQVVIISDNQNQTYLITYRSLKNNFDSHISEVDKIVNSFRTL